MEHAVAKTLTTWVWLTVLWTLDAQDANMTGSSQPLDTQFQRFATMLTVEEMFTENEARKFAAHWIKAWNSRDIDEIMSHYDPNVVLVSPVAAKILSDPSGTVKGKEELRMYFRRGLEAYPNLKFELVDVLWGLSSIVLYYVNQRGTKTSELMEFGAGGKVIRVVANYSE